MCCLGFPLLVAGQHLVPNLGEACDQRKPSKMSLYLPAQLVASKAHPPNQPLSEKALPTCEPGTSIHQKSLGVHKILVRKIWFYHPPSEKGPK